MDASPILDADGKPVERPLSITGCVFGICLEDSAGRIVPVLLTIGGADVLAVFSDKAKLDQCFAECGIVPLKVKQITDGAGFLASLPPELPVVLDPWKTERGTTRFTLVKRV